jgi:uroporphyrinogen-III synthase
MNEPPGPVAGSSRRGHPPTAWSAELTGPDPDAVRVETTGPVLAGFRIGVTSDRRSGDLIDAFVRRGAEVIHAPAVRIAPVEQDEILLGDTRAVIECRPDVVIVTTAYGFRRWVEAADAERTASTVGLALDGGVAGKRVAVQLHGHEDVEQLERLRSAGATVLTVAPYRWVRPTDESRLGRLVAAVAAREVDVVTFTSAPAVDGLVSAAAQLGMDGVLVDALRRGVTAAAVGPVTAAPLLDLGVTPIVPDRFRMGALIRSVVEHLTVNGVDEVETALGPLVVHGRVVTFGGETVTLARGPRAMLAALMSEPGAVLSRERLLDELPEAENEHALDMAVSRLRSALPDRQLVQTVVRRGYRLNV